MWLCSTKKVENHCLHNVDSSLYQFINREVDFTVLATFMLVCKESGASIVSFWKGAETSL